MPGNPIPWLSDINSMRRPSISWLHKNTSSRAILLAIRCRYVQYVSDRYSGYFKGLDCIGDRS